MTHHRITRKCGPTYVNVGGEWFEQVDGNLIPSSGPTGPIFNIEVSNYVKYPDGTIVEQTDEPFPSD